MTAKECIKKKFYNEVLIELDSGEFLDIQKAMIEFAKYHVKIVNFFNAHPDGIIEFG